MTNNLIDPYSACHVAEPWRRLSKSWNITWRIDTKGILSPGSLWSRMPSRSNRPHSCVERKCISSYLEPRKRAKILLFYVIFFWNSTFSGCEHFSILRWLNWFFRNWQFTWVLLLHGPSELQRVLPDFVCVLLCCLVLSIASFWLVGCLEWLCTNVPALLTKQITPECNIEKHEKDWKSAFPRRKSVFSQRKRTFSRWTTFIFWGA